LLDSILNKKASPEIRFEFSSIKEDLLLAIWNNECIAYSKLRKQVEKEVREIEKHRIVLPPPEPINFPAGSNVRWWR